MSKQGLKMLYLTTWPQNRSGFKCMSNLFACKYNDLYNYVPNTVDDCSSMLTKLNNICSDDCACGGKCKIINLIY